MFSELIQLIGMLTDNDEFGEDNPYVEAVVRELQKAEEYIEGLQTKVSLLEAKYKSLKMRIDALAIGELPME